jgi:hypothetical protein
VRAAFYIILDVEVWRGARKAESKALWQSCQPKGYVKAQITYTLENGPGAAALLSIIGYFHSKLWKLCNLKT